MPHIAVVNVWSGGKDHSAPVRYKACRLLAGHAARVGALRQGWTEDELTEVLLHLLGYDHERSRAAEKTMTQKQETQPQTTKATSK